MLKKIAVVTLLALPTLALANPYLVAGGALGRADMSDVEATYGPGAQLSSDEEFGRALIGIGADINTHLGVEALYLTEGESTVRDSFGQEDVVTNSGLQFALIGKAPLGAQLSLFGKLSANYLRVEDKFTSPMFPASNYSISDSKTHLGFGAGLYLQASDQVGVRLGLERIQVREAFTGVSSDSDIDQATLAFIFFL